MLLFFDIDGTLVKADEPFLIPESAARAIKLAKENGHICMINTGRTMKLVGKNLTKQAPFAGIAMGNATEDVKKMADYITTNVEADGIWNALKWLGVI